MFKSVKRVKLENKDAKKKNEDNAKGNSTKGDADTSNPVKNGLIK